ncbi:MarR family winged helix-turn-helix transcriptional regulator [Miltoncostaea marina]|uniref:MarR family winged helix-turn-helix transcriptional regulator n=1 Tax=Miltoncostaea marina TaxID=2843215 RepID=UPI001C3C1FBF|nr:MarR family transcriptional regulator [Miltoncostaea marina]
MSNDLRGCAMAGDPDAPVRRMLEQWAREMPDVDAAAMALFGRLSRVHAAASRAIEAGLAPHGLSRAEFDVLATLRRAGAPYRLAAGELAASMLLSPAATTNRVDRLQAAGLVERLPDPADRRAVVVGLTRRGRALAERAVRDHAANERRLLSGLSADEQRALAELLARLGRSVAGHAPGR